MDHSSPLFTTYRSALIGIPVSAVWRGHGSAIFLEMGMLTPQTRRDGSAANPRGEFTVMIEWAWRIESERAILCGSDSDDGLIENCLNRLKGQTVHDVSLFGRIPELCLSLTDDLFISSFMKADGDPQWGIIFNAAGEKRSTILSVENGLVIETEV